MAKTIYAFILYFHMLVHQAPCLTLPGVLNQYRHCIEFADILNVLFTKYSEFEDLFSGNISRSKPSLLFSNYLFSLGLRLFQIKFLYAFAQMSESDD